MILHVVPTVAVEASGPSYSVRSTCGALSQAGVDIQLACLDWCENNHDLAYQNLFRIDSWLPKKLGGSLEMWQWMKENSKAGRFDIIHSHGLWMLPNIYAAAYNNNVPFVVSPRGSLSQWALESGSSFKNHFGICFSTALLIELIAFT